MKVSFTYIYSFFIYIIILLNLGFVNLFFQSDRITFKVSIILAIIVFFIYMFQPRKKYINKNIIIYLILAFSLYIIEFLRKMRPFSISKDNMIYQFGGIILLLLIFPISEILCTEKKKFLSTIVTLGYVILLIKFGVWFFYNFFNINLAPGIWGYKIEWTRVFMGHVFTRLSGTFIDALLWVYSFTMLIDINNKLHKRILGGIGMIFLLFYAIVVTQYRMILILYILTLLLLLFYISYRSNKRAASILILILFFCLILIVNWSSISSFISTFSVNNSITGGSTSFRLLEFKYFNSLWLQNNFLFGFGFIPDMVIPYNGAGYYLSDLGFMANLYQFGIIGFCILLLPFILGLIKSFRFFHLNNYVNRNFMLIFLGLTIYMIMNLIPYNPYNPSLISLMPIYISILNYYSL